MLQLFLNSDEKVTFLGGGGSTLDMFAPQETTLSLMSSTRKPSDGDLLKYV